MRLQQLVRSQIFKSVLNVSEISIFLVMLT